MRTNRRAWTPPIPLTFLMALAVGSPLALGGCQKVKELTGQEEEKEAEPEAEPEPEVEEVKPPLPAAAKTEEAKVELTEAQDAGLAVEALAPPIVEAKPLTSLDDLLALVPAGQEFEIVGVVRDASVFLDYMEESAKFVTGPIARLAAASAGNPEFAEVAMEAGQMLPEIKSQYDKAKATIDASGVHLDKGIVFAAADDGSGVMIYSGDKPEALPDLIKALDGPGDEVKCKGVETAIGYVVCTSSDAALEAYTPGGAEGAASLRSRLASNLPGVDFEASNIIMDMPGEDVHVAIETPPGMVIMSMGLPQDNPEFQEVSTALVPGPGKLLRAVQPGSGFVWANISPQLVAEEMVSEFTSNSEVPPSVKNLASQITGEFLMGGHYDPAAIAMQFGLSDDASWVGVAAELADLVEKAKGEITEELAVPGATWDIGMVDVPVGSETVSALHAGITGVPEADVLADLTGLTADAWMFAANDAMHFALGASPEAIGRIAAAEATHESASDGLKAYLPPTLTTALEASQVSMIAHVPLDALHSPQTHEMIKTAFKNVEEVKPDLVLAILDMTSVLSSYTAWVTHSDGKPQIHVAMQAFGHHANDEGKAALAAAVAVASGADPATSYGSLVTDYPTSNRIAAYKARAGETPAALVASGFGAVVAASALAYPVIEGQRNEEMVEELNIEEGAAEKAKEESKKPKSEPKAEPKADPKPDPKPEPEPAPTEDTKPAEDTKDDTPPAVDPDPAPAEDKPPRPPIIPAKPNPRKMK